MEIIDYLKSETLSDWSAEFCVGFAAGPLRIIGAIAQIIINAIGTILSAITSCCYLLKKESPWHVKKFASHFLYSFVHIGIGIIETLPGYSFWPIFKNGDYEEDEEWYSRRRQLEA